MTRCKLQIRQSLAFRLPICYNSLVLNRNFKVRNNMSLTEIVQQLTNGYEIETSSLGGLLSFVKGKMIHLKAAVTNELFSNIFMKICGLLGTPVYVHSYYGYIWKADDKIFAYNLYEKELHNEDFITFFILNTLIGKKLKYSEYDKIDKVVKQVFSDHNLNSDDYVHYIDRSFMYRGESTDMQYLLIIKPHSLSFYCSKKEPYKEGLTKVVPHYFRKEQISLSDLSTVKSIIQKCFIVD